MKAIAKYFKPFAKFIINLAKQVFYLNLKVENEQEKRVVDVLKKVGDVFGEIQEVLTDNNPDDIKQLVMLYKVDIEPSILDFSKNMLFDKIKNSIYSDEQKAKMCSDLENIFKKIA